MVDDILQVRFVENFGHPGAAHDALYDPWICALELKEPDIHHMQREMEVVVADERLAIDEHLEVIVRLLRKFTAAFVATQIIRRT